jgi:hypothetical protein
MAFVLINDTCGGQRGEVSKSGGGQGNMSRSNAEIGKDEKWRYDVRVPSCATGPDS